jgi:LacI family transcriptional regulator
VKITIQSVADHAGVSIGTVSRVLNYDPSVSPDLLYRVKQSIETLDYSPLRKRKGSSADSSGIAGRTVGLLTLGMDHSLSQLPVVTAAIDGIREQLNIEGANLQWLDAPDPGIIPNWLPRTQVDAWIIKGAMQGDLIKATHPDLRERLDMATCVWFHGRPEGAPGHAVGVNDWEVGSLAATHLHDSGHRSVAFLSPKNNHALLKRRQHGFAARCEELGMKLTTVSENLQTWKFPLERPKSLDGVKTLLTPVLDKRRKVTAIFTPADSIAVLLYHALAERGLTVPNDFSVISANREAGLIAGLFPALTTVDIHATQTGREAVALLKRALQRGPDPAPQDIQIVPSLSEGNSVANIS